MTQPASQAEQPADQEQSPCSPATHPCLWSAETGYVIPEKFPFVTYEESDLDYLAWAKKLRPAGRGEGRTMCQVTRVVKLLIAGEDIGYVAVASHDVQRTRQLIEGLAVDSGLAITERRQESTRFANCATLKVSTPRGSERCSQGDRRNWVCDHYVNESTRYADVRLPPEYTKTV